ncbi:MAG: hypothetical protein AUI54_04655 [Acidobacteria bacterium 13_1_40CM_2_56_5]|nr:MAG: hypothetical protein AUI54_04655 [Acidobacteria bacterium 13_1_40CM_2_56_5]
MEVQKRREARRRLVSQQAGHTKVGNTLKIIPGRVGRLCRFIRKVVMNSSGYLKNSLNLVLWCDVQAEF